LAALGVAVLLAACGRRRLPTAWVAPAFLAIVLIEASHGTGQQFLSRHDPRLKQGDSLSNRAADGDLVEYLRTHAGPLRVAVDDKIVPYNFGDWFGVPQAGGYLAAVSRNAFESETHRDRMRRLLGVGFAIQDKPDSYFRHEVFRGRGGRKIFRADGPVERAFAVHQAVRIATRPNLAAFLDDQDFDLTRTAPVRGAPPELETCAEPDDVSFAELSPNRVVLRATLGCRGLVVLGDTWYPGWQATIDGRPAPLLEAYGMLRGVVVEGGTHLIEMRYRPLSVLGGAALSAAACALVLGLALWPRRRERSKT
jgi:hypothetical protein